MKATLFVLVGSWFMVSLPTFAETAQTLSVNKVPVTLEQAAHKINLNKADVGTLIRSFKGIGKKRAQAIVSYRDAHGGFKSIEDLAEVNGLGKQFISKNLPQLQHVFVVE